MGQALQRAEIGGDGDVDLRHLDEESGRADADVAGAGQVDPGADAAAMEGGDDRRPRLLRRGEAILQPYDVAQPRLGGAPGIVGPGELAGGILEIEAGAEVAAA